MRDTMEGFLDLYYTGASNYSSCIHVAEDATDAQRQALLDRYDGDYSGFLSQHAMTLLCPDILKECGDGEKS